MNEDTDQTLKSAIELHDSEIARVEIVGTTVVVKLEPAYVHKSKGVPGINDGEGWVKNAEVAIGNAVIVSGGEASGDVWDGYLLCQSRRIENVIGIPFSFEGPVTFSVEFKSGDKLEIKGSSIQIRTTSDGKYVEAFKGE